MLSRTSQALSSLLLSHCRLGQASTGAVCSSSGRAAEAAVPGLLADLARWSSLAAPALSSRAPMHAASMGSRCFATQRYRQSSSHLKPKFTGSKLKVYSSFKERFKLTGTGKIRLMHPGHRHKRHPKSADQNRRLRKGMILFNIYALTMKKLGFRMTSF